MTTEIEHSVALKPLAGASCRSHIGIECITVLKPYLKRGYLSYEDSKKLGDWESIFILTILHVVFADFVSAM